MEVEPTHARTEFYTLSLSLSHSHATQSVIVQLQAHAIVDLVVGQRDVVLNEKGRGNGNGCDESEDGEKVERASSGASLSSFLHLEHVVPLLDADLVGAGARLGGDQLLQVADGVVLADENGWK